MGSVTPLLDGTVLVAGGSDCNGDGVCVSNGAAALYVPAGVPLPPLPPFPSAPPPVFPSPTATPSPTPLPMPLPPAAGLFVGDLGDGGIETLVGSATPNVVPAGATMEVTFLFPANDDGWIYVGPRPGEGGALVNADQLGIPGKIVIRAEGDTVWLSP